MKNLLYGMLCMLAFCIVSCQEAEHDQNPQDSVAVTLSLTKGEVTETSFEFFLSAQNAVEVAYTWLESTDEALLVTPESLFKSGYVFAATAEPVSHVISDLVPETEYTVYAVARDKAEGDIKYSEIEELTVVTGDKPKFLELVSASKTGFSYKVNATEGDTFYHTYFEGWFFEYNYEMNRYYAELEGVEFDPAVFVWNLLAQYGEMTEMNASNGGVIDWYAGKENVGRDAEAFLVPGKKYYAVAALIDPSGTDWLSTPSIISFEILCWGMQQS